MSDFTAPERRQMGERVRLGRRERESDLGPFDRDRADAALPLIAQLLGLSTSSVTL
ncbi:MAG: hypothetical protein AAGH67_14340 [Cyanobacteria bacterium P01_H01_bin.162]